jgi:hydroxyacylglutathione hydrolase
MTLAIDIIPALQDNYVYLLREPNSGQVAAVDPSVAPPVEAALKARGWRLTHILNTHHHHDHTGGNLALKQAHGCKVVGPLADRERIPGIDVALAEDESFALGSAKARVIDIPGHTRGHIAFHFAADKALFCGDTLFAMGCGRLFEGTPAQMWSSLNKLKALPGDTRVYCGHEYTQANARFALTVDPGNAALAARARAVDALRAAGKVTLPALMADELATNPFLRADRPEVQRGVGMAGADPVAVFTEVRERKNRF